MLHSMTLMLPTREKVETLSPSLVTTVLCTPTAKLQVHIGVNRMVNGTKQINTYVNVSYEWSQYALVSGFSNYTYNIIFRIRINPS